MGWGEGILQWDVKLAWDVVGVREWSVGRVGVRGRDWGGGWVG